MQPVVFFVPDDTLPAGDREGAIAARTEELFGMASRLTLLGQREDFDWRIVKSEEGVDDNPMGERTGRKVYAEVERKAGPPLTPDDIHRGHGCRCRACRTAPSA